MDATNSFTTRRVGRRRLRPMFAAAVLASSVVITGCRGAGSATVNASASSADGPLHLDRSSQKQREAVFGGYRSSAFGGEAQPGSYTMEGYLTAVLTDVDEFWSGVFTRAGAAEPQVNYAFPATGETVDGQCGASGDLTMAYCSADDTIFSQAAATAIWEGSVRVNDDPDTGRASGDFSVAFLVAHEYAHNLQAELALLPTPASPERLYPVYKTELHADCWAGVWANSAYYRNALESDDLEELLAATEKVGDYSPDLTGHHGTPAQRYDAFMAGYNSGDPAQCDVWLTADYT